jgi:hypothetical protein
MSGYLQLVGAVLIILPYAGLQVGRFDPESSRYLWPNLVGSAMLAVLAGLGRDWGFLLLEGVWATVTAVSCVRPRGRRAAHHGRAASTTQESEPT